METIGGAKLYLGDCFDAMNDIETGSIDLIAADLPYGVTACEWDRVLPFDRLWEAYERVLKQDGIVVLTASQPFTTRLIISKMEWFRYELVWKKNTVTGYLNSKYQPLRNHENIIVFSPVKTTKMVYRPQGLVRIDRMRKNGSSRIYNKTGEGVRQVSYKNYPRSVLEFDSETERRHPTQKPVGLMAYLISTFSRPGDVVMDNPMGVGTTGVAALQVGRRFVGIEKNEGYYAIAREKIWKVIQTIN